MLGKRLQWPTWDGMLINLRLLDSIIVLKRTNVKWWNVSPAVNDSQVASDKLASFGALLYQGFWDFANDSQPVHHVRAIVNWKTGKTDIFLSFSLFVSCLVVDDLSMSNLWFVEYHFGRPLSACHSLYKCLESLKLLKKKKNKQNKQKTMRSLEIAFAFQSCIRT